MTSVSRTRRRLAAATVAVAVALTASPFVVPAHAAGTAEIIVDVETRYETPDSLANLSVTLISTATGAAVGGSAVTDADGVAHFTGLDNGTYVAKVAGNANFRERYSTARTLTSDSPSATAYVEVVPTHVNYGRLGGLVTKVDEISLSGMVLVFPADATTESINSGSTRPVLQTYPWDYDDSEDPALSTLSDAWQEQLPAGDYKVLVQDQDSAWVASRPGWSEYASKVWVGAGDDNDADHARTFTVAAGKVTDIGSAALPQDEGESTADDRIHGTVTGANGITLDEDVMVVLFRQTGDTWAPVTNTWAQRNGAFGFDGPIAAGTYTLLFNDITAEYQAEFLGGVRPAEGSDLPPAGVASVTVGETGTVTADYTMRKAPVDRSTGIYGVVTDDRGVGRAGEIRVYDLYGNRVGEFRTHRDGTWQAPITELAPGQYKLKAYDDADVPAFYGGRTFKSAATITVPVKGAVNVGKSNLVRKATITGTITLPAVAGAIAGESYVAIYDASGDELHSDYFDGRTGTFTFREEPGTYFVAASGSRWDPFYEGDYDPHETQFIKQFWKGKYTLGSATPIRVGAGGRVTGINITLGRALAATAAPRILGTPRTGSVLRASVGTWNVAGRVAYAYAWKRNGVVVGRAASYKVQKADEGKGLTLTIVATDTDKEFLAGTATSATVKVAVPKKPQPHKKPKKGKKGKAGKHKQGKHKKAHGAKSKQGKKK